MKRFALLVINVLVTLIGGWIIAHLIAALPIAMPDFLDDGLRAVLRFAGHSELANPDDMPALALMLILVLSWIFVGLLVALANVIIRKISARRLQH